MPPAGTYIKSVLLLFQLGDLSMRTNDNLVKFVLYLFAAAVLYKFGEIAFNWPPLF